MLSAMLLGATREKALTFLESIKEFFELGDSFEQPEKTYSAGMRLRLGFYHRPDDPGRYPVDR